VYTAALAYDLQTRRVFREGWVFAAHESEVPEPGDYVTKRIAGEPYVVARGKDGEVRVMANRCTHRGNRLCNADKGNSSSFRCPYHGWTFSNDGSLSGVPMRDGYAERLGEIRAGLGLVLAPRQTTAGSCSLARAQGITLRNLGNARHAIAAWWRCRYREHPAVGRGWIETPDVLQLEDGDGTTWTGTACSPAVVCDACGPRRSRVRPDGHGPRHGRQALEIDYATACRRSARVRRYGRLKREKVPGYIEQLEAARGKEGAHDTLVIGPPHTLIFPNLFIAEMNIMTVEPLSLGETIAYTTPVLIPGQPEMNSRTLRRTEGAMGPAGFLIADDGEIGAQPARPRRPRARVGHAQPRPRDGRDRRHRPDQQGQERGDPAARLVEALGRGA
jgi:nitrite reductase/ring-hydroxylating ferredoxin subunit